MNISTDYEIGKRIGENIRRLRKNGGLTQGDLAALSGLAEISIRQCETGKRYPQALTVFKIASALGVSTDEIYTGESTTNTNRWGFCPYCGHKLDGEFPQEDLSNKK